MLDGRRLRALDESQHDSADSLATSRMPCGGITGPQWFVCQTHPGAERWAGSNLTQRGYETYLPLHLVIRRDPVLRTMTRRIEVPLFPPYLFIRFDAARDPWTPIWHTPGVSRLLTKDDRKPHPCRSGDVEALQATEAVRRTLQPAGASYAAGEAVAVTAGPFKGTDAVILRTSRLRAVILVVLPSGPLRVDIRLDALTRPAA